MFRRVVRLVLVLIAGVLFATLVFKSRNNSMPEDFVPPTTLTLTADNFEREVLESDQPVLVDLWAAWCAPCRKLIPTIEQLADQYEGRVKFANANVDDFPELGKKYDVETIPTLLFFQNGDHIGRMWGVQSQTAIAERLDKMLEKES